MHISCAGEGTVELWSEEGIICRADVKNGWNEIPFEAGNAQAVWLTAGSGVKILGGEFTAETFSARDVEIALNICTYRREDYVYRNTGLIREKIWDNESSPLRDHLEIFISDNAGTLDFIDGAHVVVNKNVGGSGGFARGLMEILDKGRATHAVYMDDDITLMPESLERLYAFLSVVRDEYKNSPVGGAMLRLDSPCMQHESLAKWHGLLSQSLKTGIDLSERKNVIANLAGEDADYSAWWFSCVSTEMAREKGLPLPIFVRMDDVEYGLRMGVSPIALPGVNVWHEPFERKHSAGTEYYHARNSLIVNSLRTPDMPAAKLLGRLITGTLMRYRYVHAEMVIRGIEDFLKGPEFLMELDPQACNANLPKLEIVKLDSIDAAALDKSAAMRDTVKSKIISMLTLNGAFFPAKGRAWVHAHINPVCAHFRKAEAVNVIADTGLGFTVKRDNKKGLKLAVKAMKTIARLKREWPAASEKWRKAEKTITSRGFWRKYLDLD